MPHATRHPLTLLLLAVLLAAGRSADAGEGLYLTWNDCAQGPSAAHDAASACDVNTGQRTLTCAFTVPVAVDSVLGVQLIVDLQHSEATLPDWWRFATGDCRAGELRAEFDFTARSACSDVFGGFASGSLLAYYATQPRGGFNQARIVAAASRLPDYGYMRFDPDVMYYGASLVIGNARTVAPQAVCAGCAGSACLVLNSVLIQRQPGASGGDVFIAQPGAGDANFATWQGGATEGCRTVPVRSLTWGQIKSLYR